MNVAPKEMRLLLLAPTGKDAEMTRSLLGAAQIECIPCRDISSLCASIKDGAGAVLIAEEALAEPARTLLAAIVASQPPWSDLPILLLRHSASKGSSSLVLPEADLGNVTLIDRPIRVAALVSAVRVALRARERQYQIRSHIEQLKHAEQSLRDLDRKKDEFLATLAHELRNPLAAIGNAAQLISQSQATVKQISYGAGILQRQLGQLARLVDDLLDTSRVTRGKVTLQKQQVDLNAIVEGAVETIRPAIADANQDLKVELPRGPIYLEADPIRLSQILSNLLTNATKYTPPRGTVSLRIDCDHENVVMTVEDTGIGIPADALPSVFDMFVQVKRNGMDRGTGGLGLGLTLVKSFVELHGGTIEAYSEGADRGSRFVVRLPRGVAADNPELTRDESDNKKRAQAISGHRILIADDNRDQAESLSMLLEMMGNEVHTVYDGMSAIQAVHAFRPRIVLMDIGMPVMDGLEAARRIRVAFPQEPLLVAVTGWGQEDDRRRAQEAGFDHHLIKPIDWTAIDELLIRLGDKNRVSAAPEGLRG